MMFTLNSVGRRAHLQQEIRSMNGMGLDNKGKGIMRMHLRVASLGLAALGLYATMADAQAVLSVDPSTTSTSTGGTFTVDVDVSGAADLYAYQLDLAFNPSVLSAVSVTEGPFLASGGSTTTFFPGTIDNVGGTVAFNADAINGSGPGVSGSGELLAFTFDAIGNGSSTLTIQNETLLDSAFNTIADTVTAGSVTVTSGVAAAPEIDAASAASALTLLLGGVAVLRGRRLRRVMLRR
jgi:general secretion pathway protein D